MLERLRVREPWSTASALLFPVAGALALAFDTSGETVVFAVTMGLLGVATALYHALAQPWANDLDHAMMNAALAALATGAAGGGAWLMVVGAVAAAGVVEYWLDRPNRPFVAALGWVAFVGAWASGGAFFAVAGFVCTASAFVAWLEGGDRFHAAWHALISVGLLAWWAGAVIA